MFCNKGAKIFCAWLINIFILIIKKMIMWRVRYSNVTVLYLRTLRQTRDVYFRPWPNEQRNFLFFQLRFLFINKSVSFLKINCLKNVSFNNEKNYMTKRKIYIHSTWVSITVCITHAQKGYCMEPERSQVTLPRDIILEYVPAPYHKRRSLMR